MSSYRLFPVLTLVGLAIYAKTSFCVFDKTTNSNQARTGDIFYESTSPLVTVCSWHNI
jgi:hypothetical protein